jgi:hypothetical protein
VRFSVSLISPEIKHLELTKFAIEEAGNQCDMHGGLTPSRSPLHHDAADTFLSDSILFESRRLGYFCCWSCCSTLDGLVGTHYNLAISWLKDENATAASDLLPPVEIAAMIRERLTTAMDEMDVLTAILEVSSTDA